jgi:4-amino-4-deoxy-L-arabinose transferase-like glycosyltransferase
MQPMPSAPRRATLLLLAILALAMLPGLGWAPLLDWDENIYAEAARQMVLRGDYLNVTINSQPFAEKPPLVLWEMAGMFHLFGVSETAARLTSALNSLVFATALFWIARRRLGDAVAFGWAVMHGTSLIPLVFARSAAIDPTFNALMGIAALCLLEYDDAWGAWKTAGGPRRYWLWLLGAAAAMGLAVLAKGPLGGVIPLAGYGALKLAKRSPAIHIGHFAVCGALSLGIAFSWFAANWLAAGEDFLRRFAQFQGALFAKPLEGHTGPFFYHFGIGLLGAFPWTPLLLLYAVPRIRRGVWARQELRPLVAMSLGWIAFVLILFSFVQTKLPHYSSSMYIPLALLAVLAAREALAALGNVPRWTAWVMAGYGILLGAGFAALPWLAGPLARRVGADFAGAPLPDPLMALPGVVLLIGVPWAAWLFRRGRIYRAIVLGACAMGLFGLGAWGWQLPLIAAYNQGPAVALMQRAYADGADLALYRTVSFAVFFYGRRDVEVLHSYKFRGDPTRLDRPGPRPLYVIAPRSQVQRLLRDHPGLVPVQELGPLAMFRRDAAR